MYLTDQRVAAYHRDGYLLVEQLFDEPEVAVMLAAVEAGERVAGATWASSDAGGRASRLALWFDLGDDIWAAASTCPRVVNNIRILLGEEIAFFHGKVMLKEAHTGGAWEWHQDYGYWYDQGYAFPRLMSVFVALDPATRENGCLQVLRGSHRLGRLNHGRVGSQTGADPTRIREIETLFERVDCEMSPGSALFFHCNLLHSSAPNESDHDRRSFIICYNALANPQFAERKTSESRPCPVGPEDGILRFARDLAPARTRPSKHIIQRACSQQIGLTRSMVEMAGFTWVHPSWASSSGWHHVGERRIRRANGSCGRRAPRGGLHRAASSPGLPSHAPRRSAPANLAPCRCASPRAARSSWAPVRSAPVSVAPSRTARASHARRRSVPSSHASWR